MSLVDKFCFCGRLETGGMVVGILGIIGNLLVIILTSIGLVVMGQVYGQDLPPNSTPSETEQYNNVHTLLLVVIVISAILVLSCIGNLIASILLIMGTKKRHPGYVFVWLVASMISIVIGVVTFIVDFKVVNLISVGLSIYWWICIFALYQMLKREKLQPIQTGGGMMNPTSGEMKYNPGQGYTQSA